MPRKPKDHRELRIMLDTSALFTKVASDLVNAETARLILDNANHPDMKVHWYLPETVVEEREFQMRKAAASLLPSLEKIERLLGHNLGIDEVTLNKRVKAAIAKHVTALDLKIQSLDISMVDWQKVIVASVRREPPFEDSEKEKGFRDTLIAETFIQLVSQSPRTTSKCRVVLVTGDQLLADAVKFRLTDFANAQVLTGLDDLKGLINTIASQVDEAYISELQEKAVRFFFSGAENKDALYYKEQIYDTVKNTYSEELNSVPEGADFREGDGVMITPARFVRKEGQRMNWVTRLRFKAKAYRWEEEEQPSPQPLGLRAGLINSAIGPKGGLGLLSASLNREKRVTHTGSSVFEVSWSVTVDGKKKLSRASIDNIAFVETTWS